LASDVQRAKQAMLAQRYSEAVTIYQHLEVKLPTEPGIRFNLALALHSLGRYRESTKTLEGIRSAGAANPKFWFLLGEGYLRLGEPRNAIEPLAKASELSPEDLDTNLELANAWLEVGEFANAESRFRPLSQAHPELPKVWGGLALSQLGLNRRDAARQSAKQLTELPESLEQHEMLAKIYEQAGQRTEAIRELNAAEKRSPGNPGVKGELARALLANREFERAATLLRTLLAANPDDSGWQFDLGDALLNLGHAEEAIQHLTRAVEITPGLLPAQAKLGEALLQTGAVAAAVTHLERAEALDNDGSVHFQLATAYRRLGKSDLSAKAMARYLEIQKATQH